MDSEDELRLSTIVRQEVKRQLALIPQGKNYHLPLSASSESHGLLELSAQPNDYRQRLEYLLQKLSDRGFEYLPGDLPWQILAFCWSTPFIDQYRSFVRAKNIQSSRLSASRVEETSTAFWQEAKLRQWKDSKTSSLLLVQGSSQTVDDIERIAVDLVGHFGDLGVPITWVFNGRASGDLSLQNHKWDDLAVLKQLVAQAWRLSPLCSPTSLGTLIEALRGGPIEEAQLMNVMRLSLSQTRTLTIILDLGILGSRSDAAALWSLAMERLLNDKSFRESGIVLKIALLSCRKFPEIASPLIPITLRQQPLGRPLQGAARRNLHIGNSLRGSPSSAPPKVTQDQKNALKQGSESRSLQPELEYSSEIGGAAAKLAERTKISKDWFYEFKNFEKCIDASRREPTETSPRVKIAILDTGVDLTHPEIASAVDDGRIKFRDFLGETEGSITDLDGHGTHCTSLLTRLAPNAEIFVGRVFRKSRAVGSSPAVVAKAVRYAANEWKVDIISMSLGFTEADEDMRDEIMRASANRILVFAAAANNTTNEVTPIRFPARMQEVICIFSSNGYGRPSDFNPIPRYNRPNFIFPGERIEGAWPADLPSDGTFMRDGACYKVQDGTSCSTPIAAATAAGILEFTWQERERELRNAGLLRHITGMTDVFRELMVDGYKIGDNSYLYVKPWKLISIYREKDEIPIILSHILSRLDG